jgi:hypothetical protein
MIISDGGETVEFKTASPNFEREQDGRKCNTVRMFRTPGEQDLFVSSLFSLNMIRIRNPETRDSFERIITDICAFTYPTAATVYIISWENRE